MKAHDPPVVRGKVRLGIRPLRRVRRRLGAPEQPARLGVKDAQLALAAAQQETPIPAETQKTPMVAIPQRAFRDALQRAGKTHQRARRLSRRTERLGLLPLANEQVA